MKFFADVFYVASGSGVSKKGNPYMFLSVVDVESKTETFFTTDMFMIPSDLKLGDEITICVDARRNNNGASVQLNNVYKTIAKGGGEVNDS